MLAHRQYILGAVQRITSTNHDASLAAVTTHGVESSKKPDYKFQSWMLKV